MVCSGAGIFVLSGQAAAKYSGPSVIISFIITGVIALLSSLSYSELGAMMPSSGSVYTYTYAAMGEYLAWFIGWNSALVHLVSVLTVVVAWSKHVVLFIDNVSDYNVTNMFVKAPVAWNEDEERFVATGQAINLLAIAITIAITILLIIRIHQMAIVNLVLVVFKIIIIIIFIFVCCNCVNRSNYYPFFPPNEGSFNEYGVTGMLRACTYAFFAYTGFDSVSTAAQEAKSPERSLPIAIIGSTIISLLLYIGICTVMVGLVPYKLLDSDSPLSEAIKATPYGLWLSIIMDLGVIASLTTVALTDMLTQTRIFYAMAHDGLLPSFFAKIHKTTTTPWISIIISGIFYAVFSGICPVDILGETSSISSLITYIFVHITVIVMRYTHGDIQRIFQVPFGSWLIPIIGSLLCILLMSGITKPTAVRFLVWTALGQIIYFSYGFWHSKRRKSIKTASISSATELLPIVASVTEQYTQNGLESNLASENSLFSEYGVTGMLQACTYVFFANVGFDSVSTVAQEVRAPERSLPIAIIGSTIISSLLYIGVCTVMVGLVPYNLLDSDSPLAEAIKATPYGLWLSIIMNLGAIAGLTTVTLTLMLSQTRIFYAMANDGLLPQIFARIHHKRATPWLSILIIGLFCTIFSGICPVDILGETTSIGTLITYIFVHITVIVTHGDMQRPFKVPFGSWLIPTIGSLLCILLMKSITKTTGFRFLVWTALGQIIYFSYGFWHSKQRKLIKSASITSTVEILPRVAIVSEQYTQNGVELDLASENTESAV
ncbi:unnamed protein product [Rotaria sordida]|uniref:Uncharacterized protein n=1 Tax=Rotaria sordida TaxID=392033 RepID=A0A814DUG5_9BILA|nr:unnamed protein product [Rotaria sordida]